MKLPELKKKNMKSKVFSTAMMVMACLLLTPVVAEAMSHLMSMSMVPVPPSTTTPGNVVVFRITAVNRSGAGLLEVNLTSAGLPAGAEASFSPATLRFTGRVPETQTALLTIRCTSPMAVANMPFTVTGTSRRETVTITNFFTSRYAVSRQPVLQIESAKGGTVVLRGEGSTAGTYVIEASPSLTQPVWAPIGTTTADLLGLFYFQKEQMTEPMMFFRARATGELPATPTSQPPAY